MTRPIDIINHMQSIQTINIYKVSPVQNIVAADRKLSQVTGSPSRSLVFTFPKLLTLVEKKEQLQPLSNHAFFIFLKK